MTSSTNPDIVAAAKALRPQIIAARNEIEGIPAAAHCHH